MKLSEYNYILTKSMSRKELDEFINAIDLTEYHNSEKDLDGRQFYDYFHYLLSDEDENEYEFVDEDVDDDEDEDEDEDVDDDEDEEEQASEDLLEDLKNRYFFKDIVEVADRVLEPILRNAANSFGSSFPMEISADGYIYMQSNYVWTRFSEVDWHELGFVEHLDIKVPADLPFEKIYFELATALNNWEYAYVEIRPYHEYDYDVDSFVEDLLDSNDQLDPEITKLNAKRWVEAANAIKSEIEQNLFWETDTLCGYIEGEIEFLDIIDKISPQKFVITPKDLKDTDDPAVKHFELAIDPGIQFKGMEYFETSIGDFEINPRSVFEVLGL